METTNRPPMSARAPRLVGRIAVGCLTTVALILAGGPPGTAGASTTASGAAIRRGTSDPSHPFELCPVDAPRHYLDDFGQARYAGGFHRHEGIDVFARRGTRIRAPFDGVAKASTSWAGGIQVTLQGRLGFVFNAHLSRIGRMGRVHAGDVIGYVGNTGDAMGGATHDHFEWHPGGGPAVDGFRFLDRACDPARIPSRAPRLA